MPQAARAIDPTDEVSRREPRPDRLKPGGFEQLLTLREAATVLGMHWKTLEGMARTRKIPAFKVGKRWRFRLSSLNVWLENGLNSTTTDRAVLTEEEQHP
jgi:excisionase family DNA binding protein